MSDLIRVGIPIAGGSILIAWIWYHEGVRHERRVMAARLDELRHAADLRRAKHLDTYRELVRLKAKP